MGELPPRSPNPERETSQEEGQPVSRRQLCQHQPAGAHVRKVEARVDLVTQAAYILVTFKAVFGEFVGWGESIASFLTFAVIGFVLLYAVRIAVDFALLPGTRISHEQAVDRNVGVAFIESGVVIGAALILYFAI